MDRQDRQDIFYRIRKVLTVNNRSTEAQNPVYPVYPCLNPSPPVTPSDYRRVRRTFFSQVALQSAYW